jgi:hypothetical protein
VNTKWPEHGPDETGPETFETPRFAAFRTPSWLTSAGGALSLAERCVLWQRHQLLRRRPVQRGGRAEDVRHAGLPDPGAGGAGYQHHQAR